MSSRAITSTSTAPWLRLPCSGRVVGTQEHPISAEPFDGEPQAVHVVAQRVAPQLTRSLTGREEKITAAAARDVYGVVLDDGVGDGPATAAERDRRRSVRGNRSTVQGDGSRKIDVGSAGRLDDNLVEVTDGAGAGIACRHCGERLGEADTLRLVLYEGPSTDAGPQILADPADYVDAPVVSRQYCCPGCWTAVYSAVVPADHVEVLTRQVS